MSVRILSRKLEPRDVSMKLIDGSLIKGKINLYRDEGSITRVSDIFMRGDEPFIVVFDATAEGKTGRVLIVNKANIAWVSPED